MTPMGRGLAAAAMVTGILVTMAVPAVAGDAAPPNGSVVGDWKTRTLGIKQTVTFASDGTVYGDSGCNRFTGAYTITRDRIRLGPLATTLRACPEPRMEAEQIFLTKLQAAVSFTATDTVLRLRTPSDLLRLRAA